MSFRFSLVCCLALAACADPAHHGEQTAAVTDRVVCAPGPTVGGVDVSIFQGAINWPAVSASGKGFAIARVSDGTQYPDSRFAQNWAGIADAGLIRGAYQFFRPGQSAAAQAQLMIDAVGPLGHRDLPAVIDVETADGQSSATIVNAITIWLDLVEAGTGKRPIIYAASGFWNTLSGTSRFRDETLWVANYQVSCPLLPNTWSDWTFWQYSDRGSVPGIAGGVDVNHFNGTLADLEAFAQNGGIAPRVAIEVYWARQPDGSYDLRALAPPVVDHVVYSVDGWEIGSASRADGHNFPASYTFTSETDERLFEVLGYDADDAPAGRGIGLMDVTPGVGVYVKQMGNALYEIGLERAPSGVHGIEVRADGFLLTDSVSDTTRSPRGAVRSTFNQLGSRNFELRTFNADGSSRGTLRRSFVLE